MDGAQSTLFASALDISAGTESGTIRIPIKKHPIEFTQVNADTAHIGADHVHMPLDNMWNFGYVGEFYLGSGEP